MAKKEQLLILIPLNLPYLSKVKYLLFLFATVLCFDADHTYYFSLTQVVENHNSNSLEITMRLFTDDIEKALQDEGEPLRMGDKRQRKDLDVLFEDYLRKHFEIKTDQQTMLFSYIGLEVENDITYAYLEVPNFNGFSIIEFRNEFLMELYPEQLNRLNLKINGWNKTIELTKDHSSELIQN
ncbi:MAG: DUF6702 family protein [Flavobacteriales bacterium]